MIVICEECGKKYRVNPSQIKGEKAQFKCKSCSHLITVTKPEMEPPVSPPVEEPLVPKIPEEKPFPPEPATEEKAEAKKEKKAKVVKTGRGGLGLRTKMIFLFFIIPMLIIAASGYLFLTQLKNLSSLVAKEGASITQNMAEERVAEKARAVAAQCQIYLASHPNIKKEEFAYNVDFARIAVQKVGMTGYTALYAMPDSGGVWRTWAHVNPKIVSIDMEQALSKNFPKFWKVFSDVKGGKESRGYYKWKDRDGSIRDKYMVCTPVEGTPYVIAATTYLDEFTRPIKKLETRTLKMTDEAQKIIFVILGATLVLIGLIVSIYGHLITGRIKSMTNLAERISIGELDAEVEVKSKDELGDLGDAISRMQDSIRLSIQRLRRRR